jgi:hypothetical protein
MLNSKRSEGTSEDFIKSEAVLTLYSCVFFTGLNINKNKSKKQGKALLEVRGQFSFLAKGDTVC